MKFFGAILAIVGAVPAFLYPGGLMVVIIGILLFIEGSERSMTNNIVRCIQQNKLPDELHKEDMQSANSYSTDGRSY